jgi:hypothetical protein
MGRMGRCVQALLEVSACRWRFEHINMSELAPSPLLPLVLAPTLQLGMKISHLTTLLVEM